MIAFVFALAILPGQSVQELPGLRLKDLVGVYSYIGGFESETLRLKAGKSFRSEYSDDGYVPGREVPELRTGMWTFKQDQVVIRYDRPKGWTKERRYIPVRWGGLRLLIRKEKRASFVSYVNWRRKAAKENGKEMVTEEFLSDGYIKDPLTHVFVPKGFLKDFSGIK